MDTDPSVQAPHEVLVATAETDDTLLTTDAPLKTDPVLNLTDSAYVQPPTESGKLRRLLFNQKQSLTKLGLFWKEGVNLV